MKAYLTAKILEVVERVIKTSGGPTQPDAPAATTEKINPNTFRRLCVSEAVE
jgi:hypothetical protein